jgi:hypothetical protein
MSNQGRKRLEASASKLLSTKLNVPVLLTGFLGSYTDVGIAVEVPGRKGWVYVRLHTKSGNVIQAYNRNVGKAFDVPVIVERKGNKHIVIGLNHDQYSEWPSNFIADHGDQHSFGGGTGTVGSDVVWVQKRQFTPLLLAPTNPFSMKADVLGDFYSWNTHLHYLGTTGTIDLTTAIPPITDQALLLTVYLNGNTGGLSYLSGTSFTYNGQLDDPSPYISLPDDSQGIALGAILLNNGMSYIDWDHLFDIRLLVNTPNGGGGGGGGGGGSGGGAGTTTLYLNRSRHPVIDTLWSMNPIADGLASFALQAPSQHVADSSFGAGSFGGGLVTVYFNAYDTATTRRIRFNLYQVVGATHVGPPGATYGYVASQAQLVQSGYTAVLTAVSTGYSLSVNLPVTSVTPAAYLMLELEADGASTTTFIEWDGSTNARLVFEGTTHNLLSLTHADTLASAVSRGSIIAGNSTPAWAELNIGATGTVLSSNGLDAVWAAPAAVGANPTAASTGVAINGVAPTFMRSDAAFLINSLPDEKILRDLTGSPALTTLHDDWRTVGSSGVADGTLTYVTTGSSGIKISVAAGDGYIRASNDQQAELTICHWAASVDIYTFSAPAAGQETVVFVGIEMSGGSAVAVVNSSFTYFNGYDKFWLARVSYDGTTMRILNTYAHAEDVANNTRLWMRRTHPFVREEAPEGSGGLEVSSLLRALAMTAGNIWHGYNRYVLSALSSGAAFDTHYKRAGGGFNSTIGVTAWPNTQYDNASGTLQDLTNNRYGTLWVYVDVSDGTLDVMYGAVNATSVINAQADTVPTTPNHLTYHGRLIARIIFQKSAASATLVESAWVTLFAASAVGDHALLSNLQGGAANDYYHLTQVQHDDLTDGGSTVLHSHAGAGAHIIKDEGGAGLTARTYLNFIGAGVTATDNVGTDSTDITITGSSSGSIVGTTSKMEIGIDGGGAAPTVGVLLDFIVPCNLTITRWELLVTSPASGSMVLDLWMDTDANFPPNVADTITGSDKPTLTAQAKNSSSALTGWDTTWVAGDTVRVNIDSASTLTKATLILSYTRA